MAVQRRTSAERSFRALVAVATMLSLGAFAVGPSHAATTGSVAADDVADSTFHPATPTRVLDTRYGVGAPRAPLGSNARLTITFPTTLVTSAATAVVVNVTVTQATANGHLTIYAGGTEEPGTSSLNFSARRTVANLVTVTLGSGRTVTLHNVSRGTVHLIADLAGYYDTSGAGERIETVDPKRVLDTRTGIGAPARAIAAHEILTVRLRPSSVPADADAVVLNVTVTNESAPGHLIVFPGGGPAPNTSNINFAAHQTVSNLVTVRLGSDGTVALDNASSGTVQLVADLSGYYRTNGTGLRFRPTAARRVFDTRGSDQGPLGPNETLDVSVGGGTAGAVLNVTVTRPTAAGFLTVYAAGTPRPPTSSLNFVAGQTVPNLVLTEIGSLGTVTIFNGSSGTVHVFADVAGYVENLYPVVVPAPPGGTDGGGTIGTGVCTGPGQCMFVGDYTTAAGNDAAMLLTLGHGVWTATDAARPLPPDADNPLANGGGYPFTGLACDRNGPCYGGGAYTVTGGGKSLYIETLVNGSWSTMTAPLPPDAKPAPHAESSGAFPDLFDVACAAAGTCYMVGQYVNTSGQQVGLIETLTNGTWTARAAPTGIDTLRSVGCGPVHTCIATGYTSRVVQLVDGAMSVADVPPPVPSDASSLRRVSCASDSRCEAVGNRAQDGGYGFYFASYDAGSWTTTAAPMPGGATDDFTQMAGISCATTDLCAAAGTDSGNPQRPLLESLASGTWTAQFGAVDSGLGDVWTAGPPTCDATGVCVAGGSYGPDNDQGGPDRTNILVHIWDGRRWTSTPGRVAQVPQLGETTNSEIDPFVCDGAGRCYAAAATRTDHPRNFIETFVE